MRAACTRLDGSFPRLASAITFPLTSRTFRRRTSRAPKLVRMLTLVIGWMLALSLSRAVFAQGFVLEPFTILPADEVELPEGYSPPTFFIPLALDFGVLGELDLAPDEYDARGQRASVPDSPLQLVLPIPNLVPVPGGDPVPEITLVLAGVVRSQILEPDLAAQFPEIQTYAFASGEGPRITGHLVVGPDKIRIAAQTSQGLMWLEEIPAHDEHVHDRIYIAYLQSTRTDGLNDFTEPGDRDHDHDHDDDPPPVPSIASAALAPATPQLSALTAGDQLRVYRLIASTNGEFFQAREGGVRQARRTVFHRLRCDRRQCRVRAGSVRAPGNFPVQFDGDVRRSRN